MVDLQYLIFDLSSHIFKIDAGTDLALINAWVKQKQLNIYGNVTTYREGSISSLLFELGSFPEHPLDERITILANLQDLPAIAAGSLKKGVVVHVKTSFGHALCNEVAFSEQTGAMIFISYNVRQIHSHSLLAYLAASIGPVIHIYHSSDTNTEKIPEVDTVALRDIIVETSLDPNFSLCQARKRLDKLGLKSQPFQKFGEQSLDIVLIFGSRVESDVEKQLEALGCGMIKIFQLSPWLNEEFVKILPSSCQRLHLALPRSMEWSSQSLNVAQSLQFSNSKIVMDFLNYQSPLYKVLFPPELQSAQSTVNPESSKVEILLHSVFKDSLQLFQSMESTAVAFGAILADNETSKSRWIIDHGSLLEIGSSLIHSIVSCGLNINVLVIDRNPRISTAGDKFKNRRDAGLYALNYGGSYVAAICPAYSYSQAAQALQEAFDFDGPSIVTLLAPEAPDGVDNPLISVSACKRIIDSGLFSLFRWKPETAIEGCNLIVDSSKAKANLESFLKKDSNISLLLQESSLEDNNVRHDTEYEIQAKFSGIAKESYEALFKNIERKKLVILYGSDGGNAESLAKKVGFEAKEKGLYAKVYAADNFVIEDLVKEEYVLFIVSTAGQGEFPGNFRESWKSLQSLAGSGFDFSKTHYSVFALGDRHYWPRPEDSHYFCKPGKLLDQKMEDLGFKRLNLLGIGDDRDSDGYFSGFGKWSTGFWESLGVESNAVEAGATHPTDDAIKAASNYLRGTIAEGLVDTTTGALAVYDTKLTKFHGIYQQDDRDIREHRALKGMEKAYSFMIRVRVPGGVSTPAQYLAMDEISDKWANGTIKITTRQAFQFHGVVKSVLKQSIQDINRSLLDTIAACGDVNRNVMCNPSPSGDAKIFESVHKLATGLSSHLTPATSAYHEIWLDKKLVAGGEDNEPLYGKTYLPRKFKIAIAVPPSNDVDVLAHDLGYIAVVENGSVVGYNVTVGGGMGQTHGNKKTYPVLAKPLGFCLPSQAIEVGEKVMLVQRDYGNRENRKHARLKYTIEDKGLDWFKGEVEQRLGYKMGPSKPYKFTSNGDRYGWYMNGAGNWAYTLFIQNGRIKDTADYLLKTGLREIAKVHTGTFALTPNQHLVIDGIPASEKSSISSLLSKFKIDNGGLSGLRLGSMACVALPTCALAMAESERYLPELVTKIEKILENNGLRDDSITIRMTGCPNGCARPSIAEIAFIGKAPGTYNMYLGGGFAGERLNVLYKESVDEAEILRLLEPIIQDYAQERIQYEHFGDFVVRKKIVV